MWKFRCSNKNLQINALREVVWLKGVKFDSDENARQGFTTQGVHSMFGTFNKLRSILQYLSHMEALNVNRYRKRDLRGRRRFERLPFTCFAAAAKLQTIALKPAPGGVFNIFGFFFEARPDAA